MRTTMGGHSRSFGAFVPIANLQVRVFMIELVVSAGVRRDQNSLSDK